jgi:gamma-glutamyltranspeptidase / glutathione hydrolase
MFTYPGPFAGTPNVSQPGKRPRITLSLTLLFHDHQPVMAISVAEATSKIRQPSRSSSTVEYGMIPEEAFEVPRFSTEHFISSFGQDRARLGNLSVPNSLPQHVQADLKLAGTWSRPAATEWAAWR